MMELATDLTLALDAVRPVHDRAIGCAAEVRRHLLRPLVRGIHRMRPGHGIVVVGLDATQLVHSLSEEFGSLKLCKTRERSYLIKSTLQRPFSRGAIVTNDHIDQRVLQNAKILE